MKVGSDIIFTVLSVQKIGKGNKIRVSFEGYEPLNFSLDLINKFRLEKGAQISLSDLHEIINLQNEIDAKQSALRYLERRQHSELEMRRKLEKKNYEAKVINNTINFLKEYNYLDDYKYFEDYAQWLAERHYLGRCRIEQELARKGANKDIILEICDNIFRDKGNMEYESAQKILQKKQAAINRKDPSKRIPYIYNMLMRYGISTDVIRKVLDEIK
ncbi:MAG TPA: regulatory protein RecX [Candidatus Kapabacteria bacterium]|nr:regulatory protein RecX [Candidatus Kapabacteria bacterium]HOV92418.1 regulatory protein RecX [Candidatus Kapabacteria bacterium]